MSGDIPNSGLTFCKEEDIEINNFIIQKFYTEKMLKNL